MCHEDVLEDPASLPGGRRYSDEEVQQGEAGGGDKGRWGRSGEGDVKIGVQETRWRIKGGCDPSKEGQEGGG